MARSIGTPRPWWFTASAAVVLLGGYLSLWQGGNSVAAVLLVAAYTVAVPLAILRG